MCESNSSLYDNLKDKIKAACTEMKESVAMIKFLDQEHNDIFEMPVKDNKVYKELFRVHNNFLLAAFDIGFHQIQVEYPLDLQKAYELAAKMMGHNADMAVNSLKPAAITLQGLLKKEKEPKLFSNYANILQHLSISLKWLARGLSHQNDDDEKAMMYSAINEAKLSAQN